MLRRIKSKGYCAGIHTLYTETYIVDYMVPSFLFAISSAFFKSAIASTISNVSPPSLSLEEELEYSEDDDEILLV